MDPGDGIIRGSDIDLAGRIKTEPTGQADRGGQGIPRKAVGKQPLGQAEGHRGSRRSRLQGQVPHRHRHHAHGPCGVHGNLAVQPDSGGMSLSGRQDLHHHLTTAQGAGVQPGNGGVSGHRIILTGEEPLIQGFDKALIVQVPVAGVAQIFPRQKKPLCRLVKAHSRLHGGQPPAQSGGVGGPVQQALVDASQLTRLHALDGLRQVVGQRHGTDTVLQTGQAFGQIIGGGRRPFLRLAHPGGNGPRREVGGGFGRNHPA